VLDALEGGAANVVGEVRVALLHATSQPRCSSESAQLFPLPAEDLPLDPSFERTSPAPYPESMARFDDLQGLNRVYLVTPVGAPNIYDAAMRSTECRLTPSGRYHWRLATAGRI
jgi:hypothetical protein